MLEIPYINIFLLKIYVNYGKQIKSAYLETLEMASAFD